MGLTYYEAIAEPEEQIKRAFMIWELRAERVKLEADMQAQS